MSKLKSYKFDDLYEMSSGISSKPEQAGHGAPFLSFSTVFNNHFLPDTLPDLMDTLDKEKDTYSIKEGDIFLTRTSETLNELGMSSVAVKDYPEASYSGFLKRLRPKQTDVTYHKFMAFYLRDKVFRKTMNNNAIMTLRASLNEQIFSYLKLRLPEFNEQKKIGDLLFKLNQKIELNNRINVELEGMAKLVYDYWFVQFDFPDAKGKPYKSSGGKMVWNEELKRNIPAEWEVKSLGDYAEVLKGSLITAKDAIEGDIKVVAAGINFSYTHSEYNREKNTITISGSGANAGFINFWREPIFASDCITVRGTTDTETLLLLFHLKFIQNYILNQATGSAQPHVYPSDIRILNYIVPSQKIVEEFRKIVIPLNDKIANNLKEKQHLTSLRDLLLPVLMNGQISVGEAKEQKQSVTINNENETIALTIPKSKTGFAKQVLAGKIISLYRQDQNFTDIKFQKIQYLAEHIAQVDLNWNYYRKMAGPYDNKFMHTIYTKLKTSKWFEDRKGNFKPLDKVKDIDQYYQNYFNSVSSKLNKLFDLLKNTTEADCEVVATVYAIWNNLIIKKEEITEDKIATLFFEWSSRKEVYTKQHITKAIQWLKDKNFEPTGFGYIIKELMVK